jgi:hypothetical protein
MIDMLPSIAFFPSGGLGIVTSNGCIIWVILYCFGCLVNAIKNQADCFLHRAAVESKVFSLDKPMSLYKTFSGNASDQSAYFDKLALQLATVMSTIADNPYVCYTTNNPRNEVRASIWLVCCTDIYYLGGGGVDHGPH